MPPEETDVETVSRDMEVASQVSHTPHIILTAEQANSAHKINVI